MMIPAGYMYKKVGTAPAWIRDPHIIDIYSVSPCISPDFADWVGYWKHNGYWLFDTPEAIQQIAASHGLSLEGMQPFYYLVHERQWDRGRSLWCRFSPEDAFVTKVVAPMKSQCRGFDIVSFSQQSSAECSPLSCNHLANDVRVNEHCLLDTFGDAIEIIESDKLTGCEPGPYRLFEVHTLD